MVINRNKIRCKIHLRYVASCNCMICGFWSESVVGHHLLKAGGHGMATKECDSCAVPLCHHHHQALHLHGDEIEWFELNGWEYSQVLEYCRQLCLESPSKKIKDANILQDN